jgi:S-adenosyl-L-methionine hydrolase (adenosine-forming)
MRTFITLTSDFGVQSQGVGLMEATARALAPEAEVIHLMHGLPAFDITAAARTLEAVRYIPAGAHVCVCDPGVGTERKGLVCQVARGDWLVGPDNGVLLPASRVLGGITAARQITNRRFMREEISPIFHGRDVFVPVAANLARGQAFDDVGPLVAVAELLPAPYEEAEAEGARIQAAVIQINKFGSIHLNILHQVWDSFGADLGDTVQAEFASAGVATLRVCRTFGDVDPGELLILRDDYGRVEIARNQAALTELFPIEIGSSVTLYREQ